MDISVSHPTRKIKATIHLPSSKSESNRALIINALHQNASTLENLSTARDTQTLKRLLQSSDYELDVIDAGTTMRFLTAYLSTQKTERILTGTPRMCERPIGILVNALREIGAEIEFLKNEGFPPLKIKGMPNGQIKNYVKIRGDVSSQFISALLMIAPTLPQGLTLELTGEVGSVPYIQMTLQMMAAFGIKYDFNNQLIKIEPQAYRPSTFYVESDWSGASYWYSMAALAQEAEIELVGLKEHSLQGDSAIVPMLQKLGITTRFIKNALIIKKESTFSLPNHVEIDFTHCPDIAQTLAVICAGLKVNLYMTGVESLKVKETDRLLAIKNELAKFNVPVTEVEPKKYLVKGSDCSLPTTPPSIHTYDDHRMAMAFAPMALLTPVTIEHKEVVVKSYPSFWNDLQVAGFKLS